jgi:hypothetical protein
LEPKPVSFVIPRARVTGFLRRFSKDWDRQKVVGEPAVAKSLNLILILGSPTSKSFYKKLVLEDSVSLLGSTIEPSDGCQRWMLLEVTFRSDHR